MSDTGAFEPPSGPPAGWYPDPYDPTRQRYWDGRRWDMSAPAFDAGASDRYPDIGDWLDRSFRTAYRRWRAVGLLALLTAPLATVLGFAALDRLVDGVSIVDEEVVGWTNDRLPAVVVMLLLAGFASTIGWLGLAWLMLRAVDGDESTEPTWAGELRAAWRAVIAAVTIVPRAIGWLLVALVVGGVLALVVTMLTIAVPVLGVLLVLGLIPVVFWLLVKWAFVLVALVDRRGEPFTRSGRVSDQRWWFTLGRLLLLGIIVWLISVVIQSIGSLAAGNGLDGLGGTEFQFDSNDSLEPIHFDEEFDFGAWAIGVSAVTSILVTVLASSVSAVAMAVLYRTRVRRR